tara:strand:+ start:253 stop:423 length:171 start_codon:yes stop_codon:yes gene_type:complete
MMTTGSAPCARYIGTLTALERSNAAQEKEATNRIADATVVPVRHDSSQSWNWIGGM